MRKPLIIAAAVIAVATTAAPASAAKPDRLTTPPVSEPLDFCGTTITLTVIKNNVKTSTDEGASGPTEVLRGNFVVEVTAEDGRSAILRTPGRVVSTRTEDMVTVTSIGRTLLVLPPDVPGPRVVREAQRDAGLPDLGVLTGRITTVVTFDPKTGMETEAVITYNGNVTDVCDLLE